ncbi:MAG: hypothetical protein KatS3mg082_3424 [Nitrospiraceae bacterium]|nr:MAG: hypothetical protein KatS3mg082_3424 [Nitrospiraceae bacterium]
MGLERVLRAVDGLEWPEGEMPSFAVVVVDNLPDGRARDVVERLRGFFRWPLHFVEEPERGISQARNRAVAEALALGAEFVAFVDDDDVPKPDWLWWLWKRQRETGADLVFGMWQEILPPDADWLMRVWAAERRRSSGKTSSRATFGRAATRNVLIRSDLIQRLRRIRGEAFHRQYSQSGGEDTEMFQRCMQDGAMCASCPESVVYVEVTGRFRDRIRREYRYGFTHVRVIQEVDGKQYGLLDVTFDIVVLAASLVLWPTPA